MPAAEYFIASSFQLLKNRGIKMGKWGLCASLLGAATMLSAAVTDFRNFERDGKPVLIPEVQKYEAAEGVYKLPAEMTVSVPESEKLIVRQLRKELKRFNVPVVSAANGALCRFELADQGVPDNKEGYTLTIDAGGITVRARTGAGLYYGGLTLCNMIRNAASPALGFCRITDYPDFEWRSYTLNISGMSPKDLPQIKRTLDVLSKLRINNIGLTLAESFPYKKNPLTLRNEKKAYTVKQIKDLIKFCRERHIEIMPVVKLLSHTKWMTYHPNWDKMKEGVPNKPWNSLNCLLNEECRELVRMTVEEHIELFQPKIFYFGMDEVWFCPFRQCPRCKAMSPEELLGDYMKFAKGLLDKHGIRMSVCQDSSLDNPRWPWGTWFRGQLPKDVLVRWWRYSDVLPEDKMAPFKGLDLMGIGLHGKPLNIWNMAHLVKKYGGRSCGMTYWYYSDDGLLSKLKANTPDSLGGTVNGADYMWKLRDTRYPVLGYDGTFEMMRLLAPDKTTLPPLAGVAAPVPLDKAVNAELSASGKFPRFDSDAQTEELKKALAGLPERFQLLTSPGGKYYAIRLAGTKDGGRQGAQFDFGRKAEAISFLLTASRPVNGGDYHGHSYGPKRYKFDPAATLTVEYANGETRKIKLGYRKEITDWNRPFGGSGMRFAVRGIDADKNYYTFGIYDFRNPKPELAIRSLTVSTNALDGISPALLAVSAWGVDKPFENAAAVDPEEVAKRPGILPDRKPADLKVVHDFTKGLDGIKFAGSGAMLKSVKYEIIDDPGSPAKGKVLKITIPPGKYKGEDNDLGYLRFDLCMPYSLADGSESLLLDHKIAADPTDYSHSCEYLFDGPRGKRNSRMYPFKAKNEWQREIRASKKGGSKILKDLKRTKFRHISFFFFKLDNPVEIRIGNIGDAKGISIVPLWKEGGEAEVI